jgi:hypothetical protein
VAAPPPSTVTASSGNNALGMPKTIAPRSIRNAPASGGVDRIADPTDQRGQPGPLPAPGRPQRRQPRHGAERDRERGHVQPVPQAEAGVRDEQPGSSSALRCPTRLPIPFMRPLATA